MGFEPATYGLQNRCSTIELHRHAESLLLCAGKGVSTIMRCTTAIVPLSGVPARFSYR